MKVQPINYYNYGYAGKINSSSAAQSPAFGAFVVHPKFNQETFASKINPAYTFINGLLKYSIVASRRSWISPINGLIDKINVINLENKYTKNIAWDINDGNRDKYIIVLHGLSHNISRLQNLYNAVIQNTKYAIFAPEYRGMTKSDRERSDFDLSPATILEDMTMALGYLNKKGIENKNITVIGHSFGAFGATQIASKNPDLERLVLVSPTDSFKHWGTIIKDGYTKRISPAIAYFIKNFKFARYQLSTIYKTSSYLKDVKIPVSIIHSKCDRRVSPESSKHLASLCSNKERFSLLDSGGHRLDEFKINEIISILKQ